jgi:hypothetical protein
MTATVTIYKPDGTPLRSIPDPIAWNFDDNNVFHAVFPQYPGGPTSSIFTTLPVIIESPTT